MFHRQCQMLHGGAKYSTDNVKCSTEVLNFHGEGQMVHGGAKHSTDGAKCATEVLNITRTMSNVPRRC